MLSWDLGLDFLAKTGGKGKPTARGPRRPEDTHGMWSPGSGEGVGAGQPGGSSPEPSCLSLLRALGMKRHTYHQVPGRWGEPPQGGEPGAALERTPHDALPKPVPHGGKACRQGRALPTSAHCPPGPAAPGPRGRPQPQLRRGPAGSGPHTSAPLHRLMPTAAPGSCPLTGRTRKSGPAGGHTHSAVCRVPARPPGFWGHFTPSTRLPTAATQLRLPSRTRRSWACQPPASGSA